MKNLLILFAFAGILLVGCTDQNLPEDPPAPLPTETQPTPTPTPLPTATPTPLPTLTPEPTPAPTLPPIAEVVLENPDLGMLMNLELSEYNAGYYRWAIGLSNVIIDQWLEDYPDMYILRSEAYWEIGDYDQAIDDLKTALNRPGLEDADKYLSASNNLCWNLALLERPEEALPFCEQAVGFVEKLWDNPSDFPMTVEQHEAMVLDSRGLVYGLLGKTEEAISDFERVLELGASISMPPDVLEMRDQWLAALKQGEDPFTPEAIAALKEEEIVASKEQYPEPEMRQDYSMETFANILENDGFSFISSDVNHNGVGYDVYFTMADSCSIVMMLFKTDTDDLGQASMILSDCTELQYQAEFRWMVKLLLFDDPRADMDCILLGEWYAWEQTKLVDLIEGSIEEDEITIGGIKFGGTRDRLEGEEDFMIVLHAGGN